MEVRGGEVVEASGGIAVLALAEVAVEDRGERGVVDEPAEEPVEQ